MRKAMWSLAALALLGRGAVAQPPSGQWWVLHDEVVKPSQLAAYEQTAKEFQALVKANKKSMPTFFYTVLQGDDMTYTYAAPIKNFASLDTINGEFGAMAMAAGPKFAELMAHAGNSMESWSEMVVGLDPELSYKPASPRLKPEAAAYYHYTIYRIVPGKEDDAKAVARDYVALFTSKGVVNGYNIYWALNGKDLPGLAVEQWANDEADFHAQEAKTRAMLGDSVKPLDQRALAITRRVEQRGAWLRADLSVWPEEPAKK